MAEPNVVMGFDAVVVIQGTTFGVRNCSVDRGADPHEVGDTVDGQYKTTKAGRIEARVSLQFFEKDNINYFTSPIEFKEGTYLAPVRIFPQGLGGDDYNFPFFLVNSVSHGIDVNNPNDMRLQGVSIGVYTVPGE